MRAGHTSPTSGINPMLSGVLAALIGGLGSLKGAVIGGLALGLAEVMLRTWLPGTAAALSFVSVSMRGQVLSGFAAVPEERQDDACGPDRGAHETGVSPGRPLSARPIKHARENAMNVTPCSNGRPAW